MAANKIERLVVALTATLTTNILNPGTTTGGVGLTNRNCFLLVYQIRVVNKSGVAGTFSLWLGATGANAAGTELATARAVPAYGEVILQYPKGLRLDVADFLVGGANAVTTNTIEISYELGVQ